MTYRYRYQQRSAARSMGGVGGSFVRAPTGPTGPMPTDPALLQILQELMKQRDAGTGEVINPPTAQPPSGTATSRVGQKVNGKSATGQPITGTITQDVNGVLTVKWADGVESQYGPDGKAIAPPGGAETGPPAAPAGPTLPAGATAIGTTADGKTVVRLANGAVGLLNPDGTIANVGAGAPMNGGTGAQAAIGGGDPRGRPAPTPVVAPLSTTAPSPEQAPLAGPAPQRDLNGPQGPADYVAPAGPAGYMPPVGGDPNAPVGVSGPTGPLGVDTTPIAQPAATGPAGVTGPTGPAGPVEPGPGAAAEHYGEGSGYNDRMTGTMVDTGQPSGLLQPEPVGQPMQNTPPQGPRDYFDPLAASGGPQGFPQPVTPPPPDFSSALNTLGAMPDPGIVEAPPQYQFQLPPLVDEHNNATLTQ